MDSEDEIQEKEERRKVAIVLKQTPRAGGKIFKKAFVPAARDRRDSDILR